MARCEICRAEGVEVQLIGWQLCAVCRASKDAETRDRQRQDEEERRHRERMAAEETRHRELMEATANESPRYAERADTHRSYLDSDREFSTYSPSQSSQSPPSSGFETASFAWLARTYGPYWKSQLAQVTDLQRKGQAGLAFDVFEQAMNKELYNLTRSSFKYEEETIRRHFSPAIDLLPQFGTDYDDRKAALRIGLQMLIQWHEQRVSIGNAPEVALNIPTSLDEVPPVFGSAMLVLGAGVLVALFAGWNLWLFVPLWAIASFVATFVFKAITIKQRIELAALALLFLIGAWPIVKKGGLEMILGIPLWAGVCFVVVCVYEVVEHFIGSADPPSAKEPAQTGQSLDAPMPVPPNSDEKSKWKDSIYNPKEFRDK